MTATILKFPEKKKTTYYKVPLYGDLEVKLTIACIVLFGDAVREKQHWFNIPSEPNTGNLKMYNPRFVIECLKLSSASTLFTKTYRVAIDRIISNIEEIELTKEG